MSLKEQIDADIKKAMLNKNKEELRALRAIKAMILLAETEKGKSGDLSENIEMNLLTKAVKQRKDSIQIFADQGRDDLAEIEKEELEVIQRYLPEQLSGEELEGIVKQIISETGAQNMKDMGKVMGIASQKLAGKADGKQIAELTKKLLN
jgi:uncharacterized protein YqeY